MTWVLCLLLLLAGCAGGRDARGNADRIAAAAGFQRSEMQAGVFRLVRYVRFSPGARVVRVYIEGDGHAWSRPDRPSGDPTPWVPVALMLAARDPSASVAYLGRPCQYVAPGADPACDERYWTNARYAEPVIASASAAIDRLLAESGARAVELVGFSGGGAVAALVAARRHDILNLRTVAANLETAVWTTRHHVNALAGSLNPGDFTADLELLPQVHFTGTADTVVEPAIPLAFRARFARPGCVVAMPVPGAGHGDAWPDRWPALLSVPVLCGF